MVQGSREFSEKLTSEGLKVWGEGTPGRGHWRQNVHGMFAQGMFTELQADQCGWSDRALDRQVGAQTRKVLWPHKSSDFTSRVVGCHSWF